jgi:hypothetical protein
MTVTCLTRPETNLLELLCKKLRCVSERQLLKAMPARSLATTKSSLRRLVRAGWLGKAVVVAAVAELDGPLVAWLPGEEVPALDDVVRTLRRRDRAAVPVRTLIYWATEQAGRFIGGCGGTPRQPLQVQHDLGVAEVYFTRQQLNHKTTKQWVSEDIFRSLNVGRRTKVPDAVLISPAGKPLVAIEFGGAYSALRLKRFHTFCKLQSLPYEIW